MPNVNTDRIIADAKSLPDLVSRATAADPQLAQSLTAKALVQSKTVWGTAAMMVLSWAVGRYGLGWSPDFCALVAGLLTMGATAALRAVTRSPIGGILKAPKPQQ